MKRLGLVLTLLVVAGAGAACDDLESAAVTVNGEETSQSSVDDDLRAIRDNDALSEIASQAGGEIAASPGTIRSDITAGILGYLVRGEIAEQELASLGGEVSNADRQNARQQAIQVFGSEEAFDEFSESFQDDIIEWLAAVIALQGEIRKPADFEAVFREADVDVNPRYGTWSTQDLVVMAPSRT
jgi:hypothetical protein